MEISGLLNRIKGKTGEERPKTFLALELTDDVVVAAAWHVKEGNTEIIAIGKPVDWESMGGDDNVSLVQAIDATVSDATEGLEDNVNEVIFGVSPNWVNDQGILPASLAKIKNLCQELDLKPLGFVVITDSLLRYLKHQEGTPATIVLIQLTEDSLNLSLVKQGKILASETLGRGDDIIADVEEGLSRFGDTELPSRILVFNGMHNVDEEVQNLIGNDWQNKYKFLHIPKIESLPNDIVIRSIAVAGGMEVALSLGIDVTPPPPSAPTPDKAKNDAPAPPAVLPANAFGFTPPPPSSKEISLPPAEKINLHEEVKNKPNSLPKFFLSSLALPRLTLPKLSGFPKVNLGKPTLIILTALILLLVGFVYAVWAVPKAVVKILVVPKPINESITITLDPSATAINAENAIIPGTPVEISVSGTDSLTTTGTKIIGDQARGEVTIYNRTDLTKTFKAGTTLTHNNLRFTLDTDVTVASKSSGADYIDVPGKATAQITAAAIGEGSNLPENQEFSLENFSTSSYIARNDNALSGGSSQEVQVVAEDDISKLEEMLIDKLKEEARVMLLSELGGGTGVFLKADGTAVESFNLSAKEDEEASALTGDMTLKVQGISYQERDVIELLSSAITTAIPGGYKRTQDLPEVTLGEIISETASRVEVEANIALLLLPAIEPSQIAQTLTGLPSDAIENTLSGQIGFRGAEVAITPKWLEAKYKRMPRNPANITVNIEPAI